MNTITETKTDPAMIAIAKGKNQKLATSRVLKTYDAHFLSDEGLSECLCTVRGDLPIRNVSDKLQIIVATCLTSLELVRQDFCCRGKDGPKDPVIPLSQLRLIINSLELAVGLAGSIWAGADVFDDEMSKN